MSPGDTSVVRATFPLWQRLALFCLGYFLCAQGGSYLSVRGSTYVSFWLPAGLYVATLLLNRTRDWHWFVLVGFPANLAFDLLRGTQFLPVIFFYLANTAQCVLGAWLVRRFVAERPMMNTLRDFFGLLAFAAVIGAGVGAVIGATTVVAFGFSHSFAESLKIWWGSTGMAVLVLSPFILAWFSQGEAEPLMPARKILEAALLGIGLVALNWYVLVNRGGIFSAYKAWVVPFLLWAGLRFGVRGATAATLLLALPASYLTVQYQRGLSPDEVVSGEYVFILQTVLAVASLVSLIPALVLSERDMTMAKLRESEERFRTLTEAAFEGIGICENGRIVDVNDQCLRMIGYERHEVIGRPVLDMVAEESRAMVAEAMRTGQETTYEHRLLRKDGTSIDAEARARVVHIGNRALRMTALRDITERKRHERAMRESEEKFSKVFRSSPAPMCITRCDDGRLVDVNPAVERTSGFRRDELLGRTTPALNAWFELSQRERLLQRIQKYGEVLNEEVLMRSKKGQILLLQYSGVVIEISGEKFLLSVLIDLTARKEAEEALRRNEELFRAIVGDQTEMIVRWKPDGIRTFVNEAYCRIFGGKPEDYLGTSFFPLIAPEYREIIKEKVLTLSPGNPVVTTIHRSISNDGRSHWQEWTDRGIFDETGQLVELQSTGRDITERKAAEDSLREAQQRELQAREEFAHLLLNAQEQERQRLANELHDSLGQNLSVIKNRLHLARRPSSTPAEAASNLDALERVTDEAIAETRNLARGLRPLHIEQIGLTESLRALINEIASSTDIEFERRVENVDDVLKGDAATHVYRIVQETLNNLVKHSQGSRATITIERDIRYVRVVIRDDGVGFDTEHRAKGGLGLTSLDERARILGGKMRIDTAPKKGTCLEFEIPIKEVEEPLASFAVSP